MTKFPYTEAALVADRARYLLAPTSAGLRGGAVLIADFDPARDSAPRIPLV